MKITIYIDCENIFELRQHLQVIGEQIRCKLKKEKLNQFEDEFVNAENLDDNNCYGTHEVEIISELGEDIKTANNILLDRKNKRRIGNK